MVLWKRCVIYSCRLLLDRIYVDSLVHDSDVLKLLLAKFGEDRVILGSDYPFPLGEIDRPGRLIETTEFSADQEESTRIKEKLLWRNALAFLRRHPNPTEPY